MRVFVLIFYCGGVWGVSVEECSTSMGKFGGEGMRVVEDGRF